MMSPQVIIAYICAMLLLTTGFVVGMVMAPDMELEHKRDMQMERYFDCVQECEEKIQTLTIQEDCIDYCFEKYSIQGVK